MNILKLKDIIKSIDDSEISSISTGLSCSIVDEVFTLIRKKGIREVSVNFDEMFIITRFAIANASGKDVDWDVLKIIRDGEIDRFFGVKLYLEDYECHERKSN